MKKLLSLLATVVFITEMLSCGRGGESSDPAHYNMARIPAGSFEMGSNDGTDDEKPVHSVYISEFWMDKYEVTNKSYKKCVDALSCRAPEMDVSVTRSRYYSDSRYENYPVILVSWDDAQKYCQWKGKRLPTEAEWEYAARGGLKGARYPNGDHINCGDANYERRNDKDGCFTYGGKENDTHPVGSYSANGYGLYDMAGNVWEWVSDWYDEDYYRNSPLKNPQGPSSGQYRVRRDPLGFDTYKELELIIVDGEKKVLRGGSMSTISYYVRVANRNGSTPLDKSCNIGFRCVR